MSGSDGERPEDRDGGIRLLNQFAGRSARNEPADHVQDQGLREKIPCAYAGRGDTSEEGSHSVDGISSGRMAHRGVLYLVISGAPAPEGIPELVMNCQAAGWQVVVFSTPMGVKFTDPGRLEELTGQPVRSDYRMPGAVKELPPAGSVLACPLTTWCAVRVGTSLPGWLCDR